ncbi:IS1 family transposase [Ancylothrix sp. C2]|uniref:IS1 family transposase n=1 Tax=Ancylothrix sp. D3o TaxID=2953691 RepID=UPI0021BBABC3|nr:IS1 family transposase [Ancylothrix sp. D3o]MCT7952786.1 IS1 family transposase [Ancylothrix sp. D3o]
MKNGRTSSGKQNFKCKECGRQFVLVPRHQPQSQEKKIIDKLLLEKISLAGIVRATGVSPRWLQYYVNKKLALVLRVVNVTFKKKGKLTLQCDEMWSFVGSKGNKQWICRLAIDTRTKEIVGVFIGSRDLLGAKGLWDSLPPVYRQCARRDVRAERLYTDFWQAYSTIFPTKRHKAVAKNSGLTNYIERFNNTMRQRIARLGRKVLSFSKKLSNHIGAIWYFIHHYNASLSC